MALPFVPIITAVTPLVLGAFDLYRRRSEARVPAVASAADLPRLAEALHKRMKELEDSDLEQARLLSGLSQQVEALARTLEAEAQEHRRREARWRRWIVGSLAAALVALVFAIWGLLR